MHNNGKRSTKRSIKPQVVKAAVLVKTLAGQTKTQIANDLGMTRNTVRAILLESEFERITEQTRSDVQRLLPKGILHIERELDNDKPGAGFRLLEDVGILNAQQSLSINLRDINFNVTYEKRDKPKVIDADLHDSST